MDDYVSPEQPCSVNLHELDHHHKRLCRTIAQLEEAIKSRRADSIIDEILRGLIEHTIRHFSAEEQAMEQHGFPDLAGHRVEHQKLIQKLTKFNLSNMAGRPNIPESLLSFLQSLWRNHILKSDKEYDEFVHDRWARDAESRTKT